MRNAAGVGSSDPCFSGRCRKPAAVLPAPATTIYAAQHLGAPCGLASRCRSPAFIAAAPQLQQAYQQFGRRRAVQLAAAADATGESFSSGSVKQGGLSRFLSAMYQFTRPHTMLGTSVSVLSISALACASAPAFTSAMATGLAQALVAALLMNISIVGTNQLYDIEIDKVNKPYLPLASGEFSVETGLAVVAVSTVASLAIGWSSGSPALMATLLISWVLGLVYSMELPFMRWKRSPVLAATCILSIRAVAVQLGFYWHMQHCMAVPNTLTSLSLTGVVQAAQQLPMPVMFTVGFMLLFSIVIALFKDIPDVKGDQAAGVRTLTVRLGTAAPFWACIWILTAAYVGACGYSVVMASMAPASSASMAMSAAPASLSLVPALPAKALISIFGHGVMMALLWWRALKVDLSKKEDITSCYMHIWKLFYAEYLLIPFFA